MKNLQKILLVLFPFVSWWRFTCRQSSALPNICAIKVPLIIIQIYKEDSFLLHLEKGFGFTFIRIFVRPEHFIGASVEILKIVTYRKKERIQMTLLKEKDERYAILEKHIAALEKLRKQ